MFSCLQLGWTVKSDLREHPWQKDTSVDSDSRRRLGVRVVSFLFVCCVVEKTLAQVLALLGSIQRQNSAPNDALQHRTEEQTTSLFSVTSIQFLVAMIPFENRV